MALRVIISNHFKDSWRERVNDKIDTRKVRKLIQQSIKSGKTRLRHDLDLGMMVLIKWGDVPAYVIGEFNRKKEFVAKTVLDEHMASVMGWIKSSSNGLKATLGEVVKK